VTDHHCLQFIFGPKKGIPAMVAAKLQRWAVILSAYSYEIQYRKGELLANADAMSRLPLPVSDQSVEQGETKQMSPVLQLEIKLLELERESPLTAIDVAKATNSDVILSKVLDFVLYGWPNHIEDEGLKPYHTRRRKLSVNKQCVTWGNRVIIPAKLRSSVLELMHEQHPEMVRSKMLCRSYFWWPGLDNDIERQVASCDICQQSQRQSRKSVVSPWPAPFRGVAAHSSRFR
jgi:hypothetical protein